MYLVKEKNERLAVRLLTADSDMTFAGVIAGHNPGEVWVDDVEHPQTALVWSKGLGAFLFLGRADQESLNQKLGVFIETNIVPFLKKKGINYFEFSCESEAWVPVIEQALQDRKISKGGQFVYKSGENKLTDEEIEIPASFQVISINKEFIMSIEKMGMMNGDFLIDYLKAFWGSVENYLSKGYGYVALYQDQIASFAVSSFSYRSIQAIGVETLKDFRRKGLACTLTKMLLKDFYTKGIEPWWDCMDENIASQKTAEKAGLIRDHMYQIRWFYF